jgi:hypothetical protein
MGGFWKMINNKKQTTAWVLGIACCLVMMAVPSWGQVAVPGPAAGPGTGNIKLGPLEVHPFVGVTETYSDNIYLNYGGLPSKSDFITTVTPGIMLFLPLNRHSVKVEYRADANWFSTFSENNYTNQRVGGAVDLDFPMGLTFNLSDYYADAQIPRKGPTIPGLSGPTDPFRDLPYQANDLNARAKYRFVDRWAVEARYNYYDYAYKNSYDESGSYKRNLYGGSLYYRFTPKIDALLDYNYSTVDYKTSTIDDNRNQAAYLGVTFDPTSKLKGYLKLGYAQKEYDQDLPNRNNNFSIFSVLIDLVYSLSRYDEFKLTGYRLPEEDVDTNAPFVNTYAVLGYRHKLAWNEKVSLTANVGYGTKKFEQSTVDLNGLNTALQTRDDKQWFGGVGIGYAMQTWLTFGLNYAYINNDSNFRNYTYQANTVWFNAIVAF